MRVTVGWVLRDSANTGLYWSKGTLPGYSQKDYAQRFRSKQAAEDALSRIGEFGARLQPVRLYRRVRGAP